MGLRLTNGDEKTAGLRWGGSPDPRATPVAPSQQVFFSTERYPTPFFQQSQRPSRHSFN
jgi:hypothetical protein